jgi:FixJ family two-component response regulator
MDKGRLRIAVVDDEESIRKAFQRLTRSAGMDMECFESGAEFLAAMPACKPDCIVLDLHMPDMNGFEVQQKLAQSGMRLPFVVITGHDTPESRARDGGRR